MIRTNLPVIDIATDCPETGLYRYPYERGNRADGVPYQTADIVHGTKGKFPRTVCNLTIYADNTALVLNYAPNNVTVMAQLNKVLVGLMLQGVVIESISRGAI